MLLALLQGELQSEASQLMMSASSSSRCKLGTIHADKGPENTRLHGLHADKDKVKDAIAWWSWSTAPKPAGAPPINRHACPSEAPPRRSVSSESMMRQGQGRYRGRRQGHRHHQVLVIMHVPFRGSRSIPCQPTAITPAEGARPWCHEYIYRVYMMT